MTLGVHHFLVLGALLFAAGIVTVLTKRHAIGILMGVELMLNAANLNLVAFDHFLGTAPNGQTFALFVIVIAAAEAAVALAIFLNFHNNFASIDVDRGSELKG